MYLATSLLFVRVIYLYTYSVLGKGKKGKAKVLGIAPLNERSRYQERFYSRRSGG